MNDDVKVKYAANITQLVAKARSVVRDLNPQNDLTFLRVRTKLHEILIAPGKLRIFAGCPSSVISKLPSKSKDKEYILIVVQNTNFE